MSNEENMPSSPVRAAEMPVVAGFVPQAVLCLRESLTAAGPMVESIVQYDDSVFVANPVNPKGDAVPDMSNTAVYVVRWLELNVKPILALAMNSYLQHQKIAALSAAKDGPTLKLITPDDAAGSGGRLN